MEILLGLPVRDPLTGRAISQAEREFLLAQASDWLFLMHRGHSSKYAMHRLESHLDAFNSLYGMIMRGATDMRYVDRLGERSPIFPELDEDPQERSFA
jgi:1,4-alpha-glucan branching enzyme